ncbi:MAG: hypothetical protein HRT73_00070 [Flavobacteriales bacterium]|nr:hypothetical protein [Flavobacteriales bacterium]
MRTINDKTIIFFVIIASFLIYIPYIQSFDNYHDCRYYQTGDSFMYEAITSSMVQDFDLNMENNVEPRIHLDGGFSLSPSGVLVPKYSLLFSIATIPFYWIFGSIGTMYFNLLLTVLLNVIIYAINRVFFNKDVSLITTFLFATGTIIMNYSYNYLGSLFSTVLLGLGVLYILRKNYYLAAIILGFACFAKISNAPWVMIMFLFVLIDYVRKINKNQQESIWRAIQEYSGMVVIFLISLIPLLVTNYVLYGNSFTTGYHQTVSLDENFDLFVINGVSGFTQDLGLGLYNILFHPQLGIIEANPILLLACLGVFIIKKMNHKLWAIMLLTIIVGQFLLFSKWDMWYATEFGNRFLMFSIVIFSPFLSNLLNELFLKIKIKEGSVVN